MSKYYANELLNNRKNDIQHWKYVKKIQAGKGYRYFYSWDEYKAYLADPNAEVNKTTKTVKQDVLKSRKSAEKYISKGRKKVEKISKDSRDVNTTVGNVKKINASRSQSIKEKIKNVGKRASEKWNKDKEAVKKSIEKAKNWLPNKIKEHKEEKERERKEFKQYKENLYKKYKYISRVKVNGKYIYFYSKDELDAYNRRKEYMNNEPDFMKDVKHSKYPYTSDEDAILVNPKFNLYDSDERYEYNCAECTAIYELRRRGYDVESNGESGKGWNADKYNTDKRYDLFYKNPDVHYMKTTKNDLETIKQLEKEFDQYPPGSRGDISFQWKDGGGHSVAWEKDSKGNVHIIDTQLSGHGNKVERTIGELAVEIDNSTGYYGQGKSINKFKKRSSTRVVRTDNLELKPEIKNICRDSSDSKRKPNNKNSWKLKEHTIESYKMTDEELITKYPTLTTDRQIKQIQKRGG